MMRTEAWGGLMTNASPFALPPGAAVEQVNLCADVPGQIYTRGGMRPVAFVQPAGAVLDCYPYAFEGRTMLVALQSDGTLVALDSPAYGAAVQQPQVPTISAGQGLVASSYTTQYVESGTLETASAPEADGWISVLRGGAADTTEWPYELNANTPCSEAGLPDRLVGGHAATSSVPPSLSTEQLCEA